ncbi:prolipoprotein diacylglyceryl transferase [uncultured Cedecea sp.]|uniref:prolipoprotein diacylglyceryl transferase n=1 Tax=uncultured Cedecea sp. TaxID=988762 RepID=UPI002615FDE7|nr:prolipoprotein diacylglyceryl transferase [uncultured Cedecea sp.]
MDHLVWDINPIFWDAGIFQIHWYGLFFAAAFVTGFVIARFIFSRENISLHYLDSLLVYMIIGAVVGARLAHVIFYDPVYYLHHPLQIPAVWNGGLASHGGAIGIALALYLFCKKNPSIKYLWLLDRMVIPAVLGGFFIRIGNFFNSEILGVPSDKPWAIIFSRVDSLSRHPTQLYEALTYLVIFLILFTLYIKIKPRRDGLFLGMFLSMVFFSRFLLEFTKVRQESFSDGVLLNVGQLLSIPAILVGLVLIYYYFRKKQTI